MNIAIYGPGRAGGALALAFGAAGHHVTHILGRDPAAVAQLDAMVETSGSAPDLLVLAVTDDAIPTITPRMVESAGLPMSVPAVVHVSGAVPVAALDSWSEVGTLTGSFHPLQTLPNPSVGAEHLAGSFIGITADEPLATILGDLARTIGATPIRIDDAHKPLYHAAAAAAANFVVASLAMSERLLATAGVDRSAIRPLVEAIVENSFALGPGDALTGPIARGDVATVERQLLAVREHAPDLYTPFLEMCRATAEIAGTTDEFAEVLP